MDLSDDKKYLKFQKKDRSYLAQIVFNSLLLLSMQNKTKKLKI